MDQTTPDLDAFRAQVRDFLDDALPEDIRTTMQRGYGCPQEMSARWHRILADKGWIAPSWPVGWGGTDWSAAQRNIFEEECALADAPAVDGISISMLGPLLIRRGTPEQQARFVEATRRGDIQWCQGFSEPGSGSDLASLRTRAWRDGDDYVVEGQKIWTSNAHIADWIFCLVRTDPEAPQHRGISILLIDMKSDGITVRPIRSMNGHAFFNEIFFDKVRVPAANLVGEENAGWTYAKELLGDERLTLSRTGINRNLLQRIRALAETVSEGGLPVAQQDWLLRKIARAEIRLMALEATKEHFIEQADTGSVLGPEVSMLKLQGSELIQHFELLMLEAAGDQGLAYAPDWVSGEAMPANDDRTGLAALAAGRHHHKGYTIAGGSSEVQRSIIAKRVLGL